MFHVFGLLGDLLAIAATWVSHGELGLVNCRNDLSLNQYGSEENRCHSVDATS